MWTKVHQGTHAIKSLFVLVILNFYLLLGDANGWAPEDMFATNEREYGVQTTFKENLEGYTVPLNTDRTSEEYRYTD